MAAAPDPARVDADGPRPGPSGLALSPTCLDGVGPARAKRLAAIGVHTVGDLLFLLPRRLEQAPERVPIAVAREQRGERVVVRGVVQSVRLTRFRGRRSLVRAKLADESGSIDAVFFNQPWMRDHLPQGESLELSGQVVESKGPALASPRIGREARPLPEGGSLEVSYNAADGLSQDFLRGLCAAAARRFAAEVTEPLPRELLAHLGLPALSKAVREAHRPTDRAAFRAARRRLAFEALLGLQARLVLRRAERDASRARAIELDDGTWAELLQVFPFALTPGQERITGELRGDLERRVPMRRLIQGDVGSGKTVLALFAAMAAARAGGQAAILAPTELLAEQHAYGARELLARAGIASDLLTGSLRARQRRGVLAGLASGATGVVFGTHALFSRDVTYARLDVAIIDEQHRFGVGQRQALMEKGADVHTLLLTATPIPRTLALTLYGDLDVSVLRESPPGRGALATHWVRGARRRELKAFLLQRLEAGEQVFWVCPRIGEADQELDAGQSLSSIGAEERYAKFLRSGFEPHGVELVHGRLDARERAARLDRFRRGESRVAVATTVIEVGVDVPAATVMVVEDAERMGLAQLHQLRGRVGRGESDAWFLLCGKTSARERFELLERTRDGFEIAEEDLRARGMGELAGLRQSGLGLAGLDACVDAEEDLDLLLAARDLVRADAGLCAHYTRQAALPAVITP